MSRTNVPTVTISQAKTLLRALGSEHSVLLLSPPGVGKSDAVRQAAEAAGLPCRSLLGTQIAPEDVSGIPRIVGERSVFCPPRVLLPEVAEPFCLFLDELPACSPDIQKAFYSLLLERRVGEYELPAGTWVVAAGNRMEDRALVRPPSSALLNRVTVLHVRVDHREWLRWALSRGVRADVTAFVRAQPASLMRSVPAEPVPFSTPRSWTALARSLTLTDCAGALDRALRRALAFGSVSPEDAELFCAFTEAQIHELRDPSEYVRRPELLPSADTALWFALAAVRSALEQGSLEGIPATLVDRFLRTLPIEHRAVVLVDCVPRWAELGADPALLATLREVLGP
ncbi:MAG: MoxR family ATPase [Pseudomonadota bacterium]